MKRIYVFIPSGKGVKGVDQAEVEVAKALLKGFCSTTPIHKRYESVGVKTDDYWTTQKWGCVLTSIADDYERAKLVLQDFNFYIVEKQINKEHLNI